VESPFAERRRIRKFFIVLCFVYSFVTYAVARSGGAVSMVAYVFITVVTTLIAEDQNFGAAPAAAPVEELALEEAVALPPAPAENPGVCTLIFFLPVC
jgi:hypothetical protein